MRLKRIKTNSTHTFACQSCTYTDLYLCLGVAGELGELYGCAVMN